MGELAVIVIGKIIAQTIGLFVRFYYFKVIGRSKKLSELSDDVSNEYEDMGKSLKQNFYNGVVGFAFLFLMIILLANVLYK